MVLGSYLIATVIVAVLALLVISFFAFRRLFGVWMNYRGDQVIVCPETKLPAGVTVDLKRAQTSAFFGQDPDLRLASCTRWPEKAGCGEECLAQIEAAPGECRVRHKLEHWYVGRSCIYCRKKFDQVRWHDHKPGLVSPEGAFVSWDDIPVESVPKVLSTHFAVCWSCDTIERFRRQHPDLITDISGRDRASGVIR